MMILWRRMMRVMIWLGRMEWAAMSDTLPGYHRPLVRPRASCFANLRRPHSFISPSVHGGVDGAKLAGIQSVTAGRSTGMYAMQEKADIADRSWKDDT